MSVNPYHPPASTGAAPPGELAGAGTRLLAVIIESLVLLPITIPIAYFMGSFDGIMTGRQPPFINTVAMTIVGCGAFIGINWVFLRNGQTIGKKAAGVRIVSLDGSVLPVQRLLVTRYVPWWAASIVPVVGGLLALIDALFIFRKDRRCIHDHIAGTKVIKVQKQP